jgi:hypothetical protein
MIHVKLPLYSNLVGISWIVQLHSPAALFQEKESTEPIGYRRFGGPQYRSARGGEANIHDHSGARIRARLAQPVAQSLYSLYMALYGSLVK